MQYDMIVKYSMSIRSCTRRNVKRDIKIKSETEVGGGRSRNIYSITIITDHLYNIIMTSLLC